MIDTVEELRRLYAQPSDRAVRKQLSRLDRHCRRFIELSPFVVMASGRGEHLDASPRGGAPGFVEIIDDVTLRIPDATGNNRLDSLENIVTSGQVGLLFLIPGVDETLRVNGAARLFAGQDQASKVVVEITVREAFLHCAKALMRSRLWSDQARQDRSMLPSINQMLAEQTGAGGSVESQEEMVERYRKTLELEKARKARK
ncbi:MAG TPA: MSMEG_1061 family FMN-dependent PPOX-type flavoprotein [Thermoanaerobaculia bacterium]|nr:MSMEG_1061 family FMN-dependent PPOX-type flavoprotein [Thermoanaerobaculia bacterium]